MTTALVIGAGGQDGTLLAMHLKSKDYQVIGVSRETVNPWCDRMYHLDLASKPALRQILADSAPDEVYYLAAHHRSSQEAAVPGLVGEVTAIFQVNLGSFVELLEVLRRDLPQTRVFYAASSLIYEGVEAAEVTEATQPEPRSPYAIAKFAAMRAAEYFREAHGMHVSVGIMFNHESRFRPEKFVSQRIARQAKAVMKGAADELVVGDLGAACDWGYAGDFVDAMWRMLQRDVSDTYIVATGRLHTVEDWVSICCGLAGLEAGKIVREDSSILSRRPAPITGNSRKLRDATGWSPTVTFEQMVQEIFSEVP